MASMTCLGSRLLPLVCVMLMFQISNAQIGTQQITTMNMEMLPPMTSPTGAPILNPACVEKYYDTLLLPPVMPQSGQYSAKSGRHYTRKTSKNHDSYRITARKITQSVLPPVAAAAAQPGACAGYQPGQKTTVFAYGTTTKDGVATHNWPSYTIEAMRNKPVKVNWVNELLNPRTRRFHTHLFKEALDQTLHWANPAGLGGKGTDSSPCHCAMMGNCANDTDCSKAATEHYMGPVPIVTHLHGNEAAYDFSDGYPEAWYMPDSKNKGYSQVGTWYNTFEKQTKKVLGDKWSDDNAIFTYKNTQRSTQLWFHDHVLGITRLNVYAGLAGLYHVREKDIRKGPEFPGLPYPPPGIGFKDSKVREIPMAIQDRVFDVNSQLYYPANNISRANTLPNGMVPPQWIPEFLGVTVDGNPDSPSAHVMVVNGKTWPKLAVQREPYRLRLLNGCNARVLIPYFSTVPPTADQTVIPEENRLPFYAIGNEAGFFPTVHGPVTSVLMGPAERYDIIIDFSQVPAGQAVYLLNAGPETPYTGNNNGDGLTVHTAQIMRFDVQNSAICKTFDDTTRATLSAALSKAYKIDNYPQPLRTRKHTLLEVGDMAAGNIIALYLGQANTTGGVNSGIIRTWSDPVNTNPETNVYEDWELINLTPDSHPIHIHEVFFQVVDRRSISVQDVNGVATWTDLNTPLPNDINREAILSVSGPCTGGACVLQKDTILVAPQSIFTVRLRTAQKPGLFPWHCHLLEHEDNEMMRPWCIGQPGYIDPKTGGKMCPGPPGLPPL